MQRGGRKIMGETWRAQRDRCNMANATWWARSMRRYRRNGDGAALRGHMAGAAGHLAICFLSPLPRRGGCRGRGASNRRGAIAANHLRPARCPCFPGRDFIGGADFLVSSYGRRNVAGAT